MIDPISPRYTALKKDSVVSLFLPGVTESSEMKLKHPKVSWWCLFNRVLFIHSISDIFHETLDQHHTGLKLVNNT